MVRGQPKMLVGWIGGESAKAIELEEEAFVGEVCAKLLRLFLPNQTIPIPNRVIRSTWYQNPFMRGSYSHRTVEFDKLAVPFELICEPVIKQVVIEKATNDKRTIDWPCVLFAGEATDKEFYSSTHGGLRSGKFN